MTSGRVTHEHLVAALEVGAAEVVGGRGPAAWMYVPKAPS